MGDLGDLPVFPKTPKNTNFHISPLRRRYAENGVFWGKGKNDQKWGIWEKGQKWGYPENEENGDFGGSPRNGHFWGISGKGQIWGILGVGGKVRFWAIAAANLPHTHYMTSSINQTPQESLYIYFPIYFDTIFS